MGQMGHFNVPISGTHLLHVACGGRLAIWVFLVSGFSRDNSLPLNTLRIGRLIPFIALHSLLNDTQMPLVYQVDYASYDWVKLDPTLPATRATVNQYLR